MKLTSTFTIFTVLVGILLPARYANGQGGVYDGGSNKTSNTIPIPTNNIPLPCADNAQAVRFFRSYHPKRVDHFYTTSVPEHKNAVTNLGYTAEGSVGRIWTTHQIGTVPLYRLYAPAVVDHFYTTSAPERNNAVAKFGYVSEGVAGYVYPGPMCGAIPLYRTYSHKGTDHFYTQNVAEKQNAVNNLGFSDEGIAAYILA